jgi:hypothetical protein
MVAGISGFWGAFIVGERQAKVRDRQNNIPLRKKVKINDENL